MSILIFMQLRMKKSLFRFDDALELYVAYIFCFSLNTLFDYVTALKVRSYLLKAYFQSFIEYRSQIVFLFTFIVIVFHYQMLYRKKTEVFCRTLVGDTIFSIIVRYSSDCLMILGSAYLLSVLINVYLHFNITNNLYLVLVFIVYILISASRVRKYENF